jgi:hypothetical protein
MEEQNRKIYTSLNYQHLNLAYADTLNARARQSGDRLPCLTGKWALENALW